MKYKKIKNINQYNKYCDRHAKLFEKEKAKDQDELELLEILIEEYENRVSKTQNKDFNPVELLRSMLVSNNLSQVEFSKEIKVSPQLISDILNYRRNISKDLVIKFANFFAMSQEAFSRSYELRSLTNSKSAKSKAIQNYPIHSDEVLDTLREAGQKKYSGNRKTNSKWKIIKSKTVFEKSISSTNKNSKKKDDLKKIPKIGKKIEALLNEAGITTFSKLAKTSKKKIKEILVNAGLSTQRFNAEDWPREAKELLFTKI